MSLLKKASEFNLKGSTSDLRSKVFFVLIMLLVYRIGTFIPIPGVNTTLLDQLTQAHAGGVLGMFNALTGGALGRLSIFALNIMPYITASIIMQLMSVISSDMAAMRKEGEQGRKKINQYTRYLTVFLALFQGYGIAVGIESMHMPMGGAVVFEPGLFFRFSSMITLTGGTILVMWIAEQINTKGIGNGSSLIIFAGIVSGLPGAIAGLFEMGRTGATSTIFIIIIFGAVAGLIWLIVFIEKGQRRIVINYPKRQVGNKIFGGDSTHLPLKINTAGVIPAIFASSLLLFPATIAGFTESMESSDWRSFINLYFSHGKPVYIALYSILIAFFCFFYTSIIFNPDETAENLRKNGAVVLGRRPGSHTAGYLDFVLTRVTTLGAIYMIVVCTLPELMVSKFSLPFYLGGTSLLIVVNVVIDVFTQVQTHLLSSQYENLLKKTRIRGRF